MATDNINRNISKKSLCKIGVRIFFGIKAKKDKYAFI